MLRARGHLLERVGIEAHFSFRNARLLSHAV